MIVTAEEWCNRSLNGEVCAKIFCNAPPKNQCTKCKLHFCYNHIRSHLEEFSKEELKDSNDRLEELK